MRWTEVFGWAVAAATVGIDTVTAQTTVYTDPETGFTFSTYSARYSLNARPIQYRIAIPSGADTSAGYDAVVQIAAPRELGWVGLAWGGGMTYNPLTVTYINGQTVTVSSRYATQHAAPAMFRDASYEVLRRGTHVNSTHWQVTAKCSGCTAYRGRTATTVLQPQRSNRFAFAASRTAPSQPWSNTSAIVYHDVHNYWNHDFGSAVNPQFQSLVERNRN